MNYCDIKKKMSETDSLGLWDDKELIFTAADMHKMIEVQDAKTKAFYESKIRHMISEHDVFQEFEKRAADINRKMSKLKEEAPNDKELELLYHTMLTECRIMQGLFQRLFTLKYAEESEHEIE